MKDDLISRKATIEALCDICPALKINGRCMFGSSQDCEDIKCLMSLPSAQPAQTPCDLCAYDPPSSGDGKPCSMCPASAKGGEGK